MCKSGGRRISPSRATIEASGVFLSVSDGGKNPLSGEYNPSLLDVVLSSPSSPCSSCQWTESKSWRRTITLYGLCNRFLKHRLNYSEAKSRTFTLQTASNLIEENSSSLPLITFYHVLILIHTINNTEPKSPNMPEHT